MSREYKPEERKNIQDVRPLWTMNATEQRLVSGGNDWDTDLVLFSMIPTTLLNPIFGISIDSARSGSLAQPISGLSIYQALG